MDINGLIEFVERVGFPIAISIVGAFLYWQSLKQSANRDKTNAQLLSQQVKILDDLSKVVNDGRVIQTQTHDDIEIVKKQNGDILNGVESVKKLGIDTPTEIKSHIDKAFTAVSTDITSKLDTQHTALLGKFGAFVDIVTAVQAVLTDIKKDTIIIIDSIVDEKKEKPNEKTVSIDPLLASHD